MINELKIRDGESRLNYIRRIVYGKLLDKTIDEDYSELAPLVFGKEYSSDVARRMFYGVRATLDILDKEKIDSVEEDEILKEIETKKEELIKERMKLQSTKIEYNRNLRTDSRFELFYENIRNEIQRLPLPDFELRPINLCYKESEDVQVITDIHYGANFESENNKYSTEICKERFDELLLETIEYCQKERISKLNVIELGDSIQGMLRMSDIKLNEVPVVQAVVEISRIIANYLNKLSKYVDVEYYHTMQSNHSQTRPLGSKASELATEDLELVIGNYIKDLVSNNKSINVHLSDKDYFTLELCGYECLGLHGHQVKNVRSVARDYSMLHRKFYQYVFLGHTHAGQTMVVGEGVDNAIEVLVTPSFVGSDPYSDSLKVGAKAMSKIYKFKENSGLVQITNIILN